MVCRELVRRPLVAARGHPAGAGRAARRGPFPRVVSVVPVDATRAWAGVAGRAVHRSLVFATPMAARRRSRRFDAVGVPVPSRSPAMGAHVALDELVVGGFHAVNRPIPPEEVDRIETGDRRRDRPLRRRRLVGRPPLVPRRPERAAGRGARTHAGRPHPLRDPALRQRLDAPRRRARSGPLARAGRQPAGPGPRAPPRRRTPAVGRLRARRRDGRPAADRHPHPAGRAPAPRPGAQRGPAGAADARSPPARRRLRAGRRLPRPRSGRRRARAGPVRLGRPSPRRLDPHAGRHRHRPDGLLAGRLRHRAGRRARARRSTSWSPGARPSTCRRCSAAAHPPPCATTPGSAG